MVNMCMPQALWYDWPIPDRNIIGIEAMVNIDFSSILFKKVKMSSEVGCPLKLIILEP